MKQHDWSRPQRQPLAGLGIVFLNTLWEVIKRLWPLLILMLLGENKKGKIDRNEVMAIAFLGLTIISAVLRYFYFRFFMEENKLVVKSGWLKKETRIVPLEKIQTVNIEQGPLHQVLNIVKLSVDTAGSQKAEVTIGALHLPMAEALRARLLAERTAAAEEEQAPVAVQQPILRLSDKDLLKLSLSANHIETFFLLVAFGFGLLQNLKDIDDSLFSGIKDLLPGRAIYPVLFLAIAVLMITILVSMARTFFRFYNFTVLKTGSGFRVRSGLFNVKERMVAYRKIQLVTWKTSWLRRLFGLWMLDYGIAGIDKTKPNVRMQLPLTSSGYIPFLVKDYHPLPEITGETAVRMHPSFAPRRTMLFGLAPSLLLIPLLWQAWSANALLVLMLPALLYIVSYQLQRKFHLWALEDVLYIKKGVFGEERILMQWHKLQSVQLSQSIYQRRKGLANLTIHTAGGTIYIRFIPLAAARQVTNYALFKTEAQNRSWM